MANSYLPATDAGRVNWLNNFKTKMQQYGASLGFTSSEITSIANDAAMFQYAVQLKDSVRNSLSSLSALTDALTRSSVQTNMGAFPVIPVAGTPPTSVNTGIFSRIPVYVKRIKQHANYTATLGQEFDVISPPDTFNINTAKPVLKGVVEGTYPKLSWANSKADGVQIYVDRQDGNGFIELARRNHSPYIDVSPLPANTNTVTWLYKAKYILDDEEIGIESEVIPLAITRV